MARIEGTSVWHKAIDWLEIEPVATSTGRDPTIYNVRIGRQEDLFQYSFSVADWQTEHDEMWIIARAFAEASTLAQLYLPIDIRRAGLTQQAYFCTHPGPLHLNLSGNHKNNTISFRLYLEEDTGLFRHFGMLTTIQAAEKFGNDLEMEIVKAAPNWAKNNSKTLKLVDSSSDE